MNDRNDLLLKVVVIGQFSVGKTSIIKRYVNNYFSENYKTTVGVDFALKILDVDGRKVNLQLWDIAGQERFGTMTRVYYKDTAGAIVVFDITNHSSFEAVEHWRKDLKSKLYTEEEIPIILLANKSDCVDESHQACISDEKIEEYVKENNFIRWWKCSAKNGTNITEPIHHLIQEMINQKQEKKNNNGVVDPNGGSVIVNPGKGKDTTDKPGCCLSS